MTTTLVRARARLSTAMLGVFVVLAISSPAYAAGSSMPTHMAPGRPTSDAATVPLMDTEAGDGSNVVPAQRTLPLTV